jgi:transposase
MVSAFEGNRAETKTKLPAIEKFMAAHQLPDVTVVADAGMISEANQKAIEAAGLSFIFGMKRNRFIALDGATKSVDALALIK